MNGWGSGKGRGMGAPGLMTPHDYSAAAVQMMMMQQYLMHQHMQYQQQAMRGGYEGAGWGQMSAPGMVP
jgi:hypothetical protein